MTEKDIDLLKLEAITAEVDGERTAEEDPQAAFP